MTYCVALMLDEGLIFASDSRTHAGVDNFARFCKMTVFERPGDRVLVMLSSGNLAGTQAVVSMLQQQGKAEGGAPSVWTAQTMFDVAGLVGDAMRAVDRRDAPFMGQGGVSFNASFILGGQIKGEPPRLFRLYSEGNFIEATRDTPFFQTGETKYGKPILDRVLTPATTMTDAAKCLLVSFDSTMRSNLSVGMPIDLLMYDRDSLQVSRRRRFEEDDPYFDALSRKWCEGTRRVFGELPELWWR